MKFSRHWAMPSADTFSIQPIEQFVKAYLSQSKVSIDPFARNKRWATYTNDLNSNTAAEHHMDAVEFLKLYSDREIKSDLAIFDPPYSPRQLAECYEQIGRQTTQFDTQSKTWTLWRDALSKTLTDDAVVLSFGWNTVGMGKERDFEIEEIMIVCHGGMHNDTICMAERKRLNHQTNLF